MHSSGNMVGLIEIDAARLSSDDAALDPWIAGMTGVSYREPEIQTFDAPLNTTLVRADLLELRLQLREEFQQLLERLFEHGV